MVAERVLEYSVNISHLVTVGCSFTYCQGLPDILNQGWPALLARKLNIPVVNLAVPGIGNDAIHRITYEYIYQNLPTNSKPLVIVAWSQYWRREAWYKEKNDYNIISFPDESPKDHYQYALLENWSEEDFFRKTTLYKLSLVNLLKNHNIPFLITDFTAEYDIDHNTRQKYTEMTSGIKNSIKNFFEITAHLPKLPCGHHGIEAQKELSEYTFSEIKNNFGYITPIDKPFLKLQEYITQSKNHQRHPIWCDFTL